MENLARYIIYPEGHTRVSFSQERMQHLDQEGKVVYTSKDKKTRKVFAALEWRTNLCSHILKRAEPMVHYHGFGITIRHFSSTGNPHLNSKPKTLDL